MARRLESQFVKVAWTMSASSFVVPQPLSTCYRAILAPSLPNTFRAGV